METMTDKLFNDLAESASWSAGVAFDRTNPLPLDKWSVFETLKDANDYAEKNPRAYPGQLIAYIHNNQWRIAVLVEYSDEDLGTKLIIQNLAMSSDIISPSLNISKVEINEHGYDYVLTMNNREQMGICFQTDPSSNTPVLQFLDLIGDELANLEMPVYGKEKANEMFATNEALSNLISRVEYLEEHGGGGGSSGGSTVTVTPEGTLVFTSAVTKVENGIIET